MELKLIRSIWSPRAGRKIPELKREIRKMARMALPLS
jgi:hypothetical protein